MADWLDTAVIEKRVWTPQLFSLRVAGPQPRFEAGQFAKLALDLGGERVARAFSFVNPPEASASEFFGVVVPDGRLSPALAALEPGERLYLSFSASGFLVLSEIPASDTLWMLATGTGIAPFLSILQAEDVWRRHENVVLVHSVRAVADLVYRDLIAATAARLGARFRYVPMVSRESVSATGWLQGRIPAAILDGRLERAAGEVLAPNRSQVMLCGNPDMVGDATEALVARGLRKHRRRAPGQISAERFW